MITTQHKVERSGLAGPFWGKPGLRPMSRVNPRNGGCSEYAHSASILGGVRPTVCTRAERRTDASNVDPAAAFLTGRGGEATDTS